MMHGVDRAEMVIEILFLLSVLGSAFQFLRRVCIDQVKLLLTEINYILQTIAEQVGYTDGDPRVEFTR